MSCVSLMESNVKPSSQWDWENLVMFNVMAAHNPKRTPTTVEGIDGERGFESGCASSGSDFGVAPLSKSLNSASIRSPSIGDVKILNPTFYGSEANQESVYHGKPFTKSKPAGNSNLDASVGSGEPLLSLKLGKRAYFKGAATGTDTMSSSISEMPKASATSTKRSKSSSQSAQAPCCQVEGCNLDLSSAKDYHRKHKVCEDHSKCPKVIVAGLERRFCQQCSRFHGLSEFDEKKRSCRRRLSDHNARRRKPQSDAVQLNAARMLASYNAEKQQIHVAWNGAPPPQARPRANDAWGGSSSSKISLTKDSLLKSTKLEGIHKQLQLPAVHLKSFLSMHGQDTNGSLKANGTTSEIFSQDLEESIITSNVDENPDLHRALSLLSTNSWDLSERRSTSLEHCVHANDNIMNQPVLHSLSQGSSLAPTCWRPRHQSSEAELQNYASTVDSSHYLQEFPLTRTPYESDFY